MKIIVLGSSGGAPTKRRNCTSFVLTKESYGIMFDCAEGTQRQLLLAGYKLSRIRHIFISHLHFDHIAGLVPMLSTKSMFNIPGDVTISGPPGIKEFIEYNLGLTSSRLDFNVEITEVNDGDELEFEEFKATVHKLNHRIDSFGFRLKFSDAPGNIIKDKLAAYGLAEGPVCGRLKAGEEITAPDGRAVTLADVATEPKRGRVISFAGDTYLCKGLYACVQDADAAIVESTFLEQNKDRAEERTHLTARMAGNVCERSGVKKLILYHFSASHPDTGEFAKECTEKFSGAVVAAEDLKEIEIE
ncbi:MAG: ribonuclease Z [Candidatus Delongbacteria bacterium]